MTKVIIFDFDGTIADTLEAVVNITNSLADKFGYLPVDADDINKFRNLSSLEIIQQSGINWFKIPCILAELKYLLSEQIHLMTLIDGMKETLINLKNQGYILGIMTSNSASNVEKFITNNSLNNLFEFIYGSLPVFGKSRKITALITQAQFNPENVIYVGDETRDIEAAKKSKIKAIAVTWGFNSQAILAKYQPDFIINHPQELLHIITQL
jgi:phosphoglycolate phosphatase